MTRIHAGELDLDEALVRRLLGPRGSGRAESWLDLALSDAR